MWYENLTILAGRAIKDAVLKDVGSSKVAQFRLVSNKRIKQRDGNYKEQSCFIDCEAWGPRAEYAGKYIKKGLPVRVVAELEQDEWQGADGQKRQKHKLYVNDIQVERPRDDASSADASDDAGDSQDDDSNSLPF